MNRFVIIVTVYNAGQKIARCVDSILSQTYKNFVALVADDCSTDNTWEILKGYGYKRRLFSHQNKTHIGSAVANQVEAIEIISCRKDDIIVIVDGDDYLAGDFVLEYLNKVYDNNIWLTYGQFEPLSGKFKNPCSLLSEVKTPNEQGQIITVSTNTQEYRKSGYWCTSHLRTFRRWLWDKINEDDFKYSDGTYLRTCCDVCAMFPMIEMAGSHIKFIDQVLYIYDDLTNDWGGNRVEENLRNFEYLRNKPVYNEL